jgi:hypothetical protein
MPDRTSRSLQPFGTPVLAAILLSTILVLTVGAAWSQTPQAPSPGTQAPVPQAAPGQPTPSQPTPSQPTPAANPPPEHENPGLIGEIGKLLHKLPPLKSPTETIDDLNERAKDATKGATETVTNLAKPSSMVSGRMICPVSANGAPDCKSAADKLCQDKGYKEGKSLTMDSAEKCSAKVLIPGRTRKPDDCRTDNYVTSALCQ